MTNKERLVDQHIREYEARLKHIDELMDKASEAISKIPPAEEIHAEFETLRAERKKLDTHLEEIQKKSAEEWSEKGGPMVIWDIIAERLEHLVQRIEHHKAH